MLFVVTGSVIRYIMPWFDGENGNINEVHIDLVDVAIRSSVTDATMLDAPKLHIGIEMDYPLLWNALSEWRLNIAADSPIIHFTMVRN